ncbi:unnamed protein product [Schistosoma turkestanicum]|nr:unnamed protein product [Schistosoma turkestanicum]
MANLQCKNSLGQPRDSKLFPSMASEALVGLDLVFTNDVSSQFSTVLSYGFSFLCIDLFHPKLITEKLSVSSSDAVPRSDLAYDKNGKSITKSLVGKVSTTIDVDADILSIRQTGAQLLMKELSWAAHLGLPAVSIRVNRPTNPNLARLLINFIRGEYIPIKIWLVFPMIIDFNSFDKKDMNENKESTLDEVSVYSPWHWWLNLSTMAADISDALGIVLEIQNDLPDESVIARWFVIFDKCEGIPCTAKKSSIYNQSVLQGTYESSCFV